MGVTLSFNNLLIAYGSYLKCRWNEQRSRSNSVYTGFCVNVCTVLPECLHWLYQLFWKLELWVLWIWARMIDYLIFLKA